MVNLRNRTILVIASGFFTIIIVFSLFSSLFLDMRFRYLEDESCQTYIDQITKEIQTDLQVMNAVLIGYSSWNKTYQFALDRNNDYISENLGPDLYQLSKTNIVVLFNRSGDLVFGKEYNISSGESSPVTSPDLDRIRILIPESAPDNSVSMKGIIRLSTGPALLVSEPILTDTSTGPRTGAMCLIRRIDDTFLSDLSRQIDASVSVTEYPENAAIITTPGSISPVNGTTIIGSYFTRDITNLTVYRFDVLLPRHIYDSGIMTVLFLNCFLILAGLIIGTGIILFIDRKILKRINLITSQLHASLKGSAMIHDPGRSDELEELAEAIDPLFATLARSQSELKENEKLYHRVSDTIRDGLIIFDADAMGITPVYCNPRIREIFDASCVQICEKRISGFSFPENQDLFKDKWDFLSGETTGDEEFLFWILRTDGEKRYIRFRYSIIEQEGEKIRWLGVVSDITDWKIAQTALEESEARYRYMTEEASDVHWQVDQDYVFTYISPADEKMRGYRADEVIGRSIWEVMTPDSAKKVRKIVNERQKKIRKGKILESARLEFECLCKNGSTLWIEAISKPIYDMKGSVKGYHGIYRNVTQRKNAEDAMKLANTKLNLLSSLTRHDVLNQMTLLFNSLDTLNDEPLNHFQKKLLNRGLQSAEAVNSLIAFTRDYQDIGLFKPDWFAIEDVFQSAIKNWLFSDISFITECTDLEVYADSLLEKVFYNLVDNSIRHGGEKMTRITLSGYTGPSGYHLEYSDNGRGISDDERDLIFTRGYGKNTGMGLFLVREILSITGITIDEIGHANHGVKFIILIPEGKFRFKRTE